MSRPIVFDPAVHDEVQAAFEWYEQQRPGLGHAFLAAVEAVYGRISTMPTAYQVAYKDVRRAATRRFPYSVFYRVYADRLEVVAVYHSSRDPAGWQSRV